MKLILRSRSGTVQQQQNVASVLNIVDEVQHRLQDTHMRMKEQLKGLVNTLSLEQQVHFLLWVQSVLRNPSWTDSILSILKERIVAPLGDEQSNSSSSEADSWKPYAIYSMQYVNVSSFCYLVFVA